MVEVRTTSKPESPPVAPIGRRPVFDPPFARWPAAGVYQLWLQVSAKIRVRVGGLDLVDFDGGLYVYTGRASRGLADRVLRHARGAARKHWHIDYLLARREVRLCRVTLVSAVARDECAANQALGKRNGRYVVPGFGSSDCRAGCGGHLWRMDDGA